MNPPHPADPVVLTGRRVDLRPLVPADRDGLVAAARDGELWNLTYTGVPRPEEMADRIAAYLERHRNRQMLPFTVRTVDPHLAAGGDVGDPAGGDIVGMTTFWQIAAETPRVEIGGTWYAARVQRTAVNTETKLLLLTHAFETLGCLAVEFRTHWLNRTSRRAIERLGAKQDGILRRHQVMRDGSVRDTVVYSIIDGEWPAVRGELHRRLAT